MSCNSSGIWILPWDYSLVAQMVKNLPAMQETQVRSLDCKDPLEEEMSTHSSILAWRIPWTEEPGALQSMGLQKVECHWAINTFTFSIGTENPWFWWWQWVGKNRPQLLGYPTTWGSVDKPCDLGWAFSCLEPWEMEEKPSECPVTLPTFLAANRVSGLADLNGRQ